MRRKWKRRGLIFFAAFMAGMLMSHGMTDLASDINAHMVFAESENVVSFDRDVAEANDSNLVLVNLRVHGTPGATVTATYRTSSFTAIENVDYVGVNNAISLKLDATGYVEYPISIKCLADASTREKFRVYDDNGSYGRYFDLSIVKVSSNAALGDKTSCSCYLPYDYRVKATTGISDGTFGREVAYLDDYRDIESVYHKGDNDISDGETWKTWKEGASLNNDRTRQWVNTYINTGIADAWGSYVLSSIDDDHIQCSADIHMLSGNKEFMDKYSRSSSCPGLSLYYTTEPKTKGGYKINGKCMYYISQNISPRGKDNDLIALNDLKVCATNRRYYWIQKAETWFSNKNSIYDSAFYKTAPYNGILDYGLAIYNSSGTWDREVHNIWLFLALIDDKAPEIVNQYSEYNVNTGTIRVYLRFSEPVYSSKKGSLTVKINDYGTKFYADYIAGNYTDTLVYEIPKDRTPYVKITSLNYELPNSDIGDLAYHLDAYKTVTNNFVQNTDKIRYADITDGYIDLSRPQLGIDVTTSLKARSVYNLMLSANGNGETSFTEGTVYYKWSQEDHIPDPKDTTSYDNSHILTSEERGSFGVTLIKNEAAGIPSGKYYLHALAVSKYGFSANNVFGPYTLDGDAPEITQLPLANDELRDKTYKLEMKDKELGTDYDRVSMVFDYEDGEGKEHNVRLDLLEDGEKVPSLANLIKLDFEEGKTVLTYRSCIDESIDIQQDQFILNLMGESPRLKAKIHFEAVDAAGNKGQSEPITTIYDRRSLFETVVTVPDSYEKDTSIPLSTADVFDISKAAAEEGLVFEIEDADTKALIDAGAKFDVIVNTTEVFHADTYSVKLTGLKAGHYTAVGQISGMAGETEVDLVSRAYSFYLTNGMDDATINKTNSSGNLVLTTRTFQIEDVLYYFYNSTKSSVVTHAYGATLNPANDRYEGGSTSPTFSSTIEAKKYIKYMEYQDLELIAITDSIASMLNSGTGSTVYVKAPKETMNAREGQLWVRYKRGTWTPTSGANGWAFYYYGEGDVSAGLNVNGLSANLNASIEAITNRIVDSGKDLNLVGEDYSNPRTGAPYLSDSQMHVSSESVSKSKMGTNYVTDPIYPGDAGLFRNDVTIADKPYPIATNLSLQVGESTMLYFKDPIGGQWNLLDAKDGMLLKDALGEQSTGIYTLREYGDEGVGEFTVYIDKSLPLLEVTLNKDIAGEETVITLDGTLTRVTCKNLVLGELLNEDDDEAYVAVYSYPNRSLITVLYGEQINDYMLSGGNFYLTVGDRSGNAVTYQVLTGDTPLEISVTENDTKTAVIVRTENREASEIYTFEVFLNETMIDNEFDTYKIYRDSGVYRVEVTDIYGNSVTRVLTHESPSPNLTWYYLNDNGGYSAYDPNNPVRMIMQEDQTAPRTTNVYASTSVRILFDLSSSNDEIEFEITGIDPTDYSYNSNSGLLSINTMAGWTLRVWYKNQPESDHTYVYSVDNSAPEVSASFVGTDYQAYVLIDDDGNIIVTSTFDNLNPDNYQEGDIATLDTLTYEKNGQQTKNFTSGAVISGKNIILSFADSSGIRSVTVTRNGQPLEMELTIEGKLIINSYGTYVITVTDNLGNVTTFVFINVEEDISEAKIDGEILSQDILTYGHDCLEIETRFDGTETILVQTADGSYTYEFHYEEGLLTYGQYVVHLEEYVDDDDVVRVRVRAEYVQSDGFLLEADDPLTKRGTWYTVLGNDDYVIYAMIDEAGRAHYKVEVVEREITVEALFKAGNVHLPNRYAAKLSKVAPDIVLLTGGEPVEKIVSLDYIYVTDDLTIDPSSVTPDIVSIAYSYSGLPHFDDPKVIYKDGEWVGEFIGNEYGYYRIVVTNRFNIETVYVLCKIESFASVVNIYCLDGSSVTYYGNDGTIYSNYSIELIVSSTEVHFEVNGVATSGYVEGGSTILTLNRDGNYAVRVIGANGVHEDFAFEIRSDESFLYQEAWITGYNEDALLYEQGYTNTFCSIVLGEGVVFVDMVVNDERHIVLYDNITADKKTDLGSLENAIGRYGVGKYTVGFRNKYGDLVTKTVYYNDIPSIVLSRAINNDPLTLQAYDLGLAIEKGFYSNYVLSFSTTSDTYVFTINGEEYRLDEAKTIEFTNASGTGSFSYHITYLDAYGNYVEFYAILSREEVRFDASAMNIINVGGVSYTKDDVLLTFEDGLKATLSVDGGPVSDYYSGQVHYADGEYVFVVRDIAGNQVTYAIVHKSVNEFTLTNSATGEELPDGGVVNNGAVVFEAQDGSKIKYAVRNGELVTDLSSYTFRVTGHYEILIEDLVGNQAYREFTIINNDLATFDYTAPFEYEISEVWRVTKDGTREMLNLRGKSIHLETDGDYVVVVTSLKTTHSFNFSVTINNEPPTAKLVGVEDGEVTARDVTITGLRVGDVVKIYKDGELLSTTTVALSTEVPSITSGGHYRVTITNLQGVTVEYTFTRKAVTNVAGSIFFIVASALAVAGLGIGLVYHTKLKTDD